MIRYILRKSATYLSRGLLWYGISYVRASQIFPMVSYDKVYPPYERHISFQWFYDKVYPT